MKIASNFLDNVRSNVNTNSINKFFSDWNSLSDEDKKWYRVESSWWYEWGAMHYAVDNNNAGILEALLERRFEAHTDTQKVYPLELAVMQQKWSLVKVFSKYNYPENTRQFSCVISKLLEAKQFDLALSLLKLIPQNDLPYVSLVNILCSGNGPLLDAVLHEIPTVRFSLCQFFLSSDFNHVVATHFRKTNDKERMKQYLKKGGIISPELMISDAKGEHWDWVLLYLDNMILNHRHFGRYKKNNINSGFSQLLAIAVEQNNVHIVEYLLQKNAPQQAKIGNLAPVVHAATHQQWDILNLFAQYPTQNHRDDYGLAAIIVAEQGQLSLAKGLIDANADVSVVSAQNNHTILHEAIVQWHQDKTLLDKVRQNRADFNQACAQNLYPIQLAFSCPNRSIIPHLLGAGARAFPKSYSYVIADATNGQWSAVQDFLNWTIEAEQDLPRNLLGELLHLAICQNKPEQVRYLLSKGASQTYIQNGFTPWQKVSQLGFFELINVFLEFEFNSGMDAAADVLLRLCRVGRFDLAERLLRRDVSPNKVLERSYREAVIDARGENHIQPVPEDIIGFSPLFFAIALNAPQEFVRLLLEKGSNLDHLSATNLTPFRLAITNSKPETTRVLLEGDRLPDLKDSDFQLLCKIAKANTQLGWECIFILLHFEQQGKINHATRHTYYATMLKHAVNQDNVPAINVLLPICLDQNRHMEDSLSIVYAAKNGHWRALTAILLHAEHHHQPRDFLLALFYCVQQCVLNHISQELMRVIQDKIDDKVLSQDDIELSKLPQAFLGYDLLAVAIHFNNHKIMMQYILLHDANLTTHIEIAFRQNNAEAVKELARLGSQPKLQTLMSACSLAASWGLVKTFLDYSVLDEQQLLSYVSELRKETFHNQNVDLNYLETFAFRRELQQRQERHAQELQSQAFQFAQVSANGHCILKILLLSFIFNPSIECLFLIALLIHALYAERTFATTARDCFSAIQDASGTFIHTNIMFFRGAKNDDTTMPVYERQDQLEAQSDEEEIDIIDQGDRPWLRS